MSTTPDNAEVRVEPTWSPTHFDPWPSKIWLGRVAHEWPVYAFTDRERAERWASAGRSDQRRFIAEVDLPAIVEEFEVKITPTTELIPRLVPQRP